jgi:hypothetical protein
METKDHHICGAPRIAGKPHYDRTEYLAAEEIRIAAAAGEAELPDAEHHRHREWKERRLLAVEVEWQYVRRHMAKLDRIAEHLHEERVFLEYELEEKTLKKRLKALWKTYWSKSI